MPNEGKCLYSNKRDPIIIGHASGRVEHGLYLYKLADRSVGTDGREWYLRRAVGASGQGEHIPPAKLCWACPVWPRPMPCGWASSPAWTVWTSARISTARPLAMTVWRNRTMTTPGFLVCAARSPGPNSASTAGMTAPATAAPMVWRPMPPGAQRRLVCRYRAELGLVRPEPQDQAAGRHSRAWFLY